MKRTIFNLKKSFLQPKINPKKNHLKKNIKEYKNYM